MLAESGRPTGALEEWVAETKLDGWRTQVTIDRRRRPEYRLLRCLRLHLPTHPPPGTHVRLSWRSREYDSPPNWGNEMKRSAVVVLVVLALVVAGCGDDDVNDVSDLPDGASREVVARINSLTDCEDLQAEFDQADENRSIEAEVGTFYMQVADDRMHEVGCYED